MNKSIFTKVLCLLILTFGFIFTSCVSEEELNELNRQIDELNSQIGELESDLANSNQTIEKLTDANEVLENDISKYEYRQDNSSESNDHTFSLASTTFNFNQDVSVNYSMDMFHGDATKFNKTLAVYEFFAVIDAHDQAAVSVDDTKIAETNNTKFLEATGWSKVKQINVTSGDGLDTCDTTRFVIGSRMVSDDEYDIQISIIGTRTNDEWVSNLEIGSNSTAYFNITGNHSYWKNLNNHKGFDVAAVRVLAEVKSYISSNIPAASGKIHFNVTGYSRGAALANIIGAYIEDESFEIANFTLDARTYTFATPATTTQADAANYKTIFNIVSTDDVITLIPPTSLGFKRYGIDVSSKVAGTDLEQQYKNMFGSDYFSGSYDPKSLVDVLNNIIGSSSRDGLYDIIETDDYFVEFTAEESEKADLEAQFVEVKKKLDNLGLTNFVKFKEVTLDEINGGYVCGYYICAAYFTELAENLIAELMSSSSSVMALLDYMDYINCPAIYNSGIISMLIGFDQNNFLHGHLPHAYYLILSNLPETIDTKAIYG